MSQAITVALQCIEGPVTILTPKTKPPQADWYLTYTDDLKPAPKRC
jgi:hypothetical protein